MSGSIFYHTTLMSRVYCDSMIMLAFVKFYRERDAFKKQSQQLLLFVSVEKKIWTSHDIVIAFAIDIPHKALIWLEFL